MSTTSSTPYLPYQTYKSKRHSRVLSNDTVTSQLEQLRQLQRGSSSSVDLIPTVNGLDSELTAPATTTTTIVNGDVASSDNDGPTTRSTSNSRPASVVIAPQQQVNGKDTPASSGQTSPSSPSAPAVAGIRINGEPLVADAHPNFQAHSHSHSQSTTEPSSPSSTQSATAPVVSLNDAVVPPNGKVAATGAVAFPSLSIAKTQNSISERTAGKAPEAGPSTPTSPLSPRSSVHNPRRTSTFRYVSLRPSANAATSSTAPRTSSPLRPASTLGHNRATSTTFPGLSPLSSARQLGDQPSPLQSASRSPASIHSELAPDTQAQAHTPLLRPGIGINNNARAQQHHQRSASAQVSHNTHVNANPKMNPPQRTSSLPPPPSAPPHAISFLSPSLTPNSTLTPCLAPALGSAPSNSSASSSRVQSPSPISSTPTTSIVSTQTYRAPYRPGFQPRGVIRPVTDDFLALRKRARDKERIELTRLERRFEKLVDLHFSSKDKDKSDSDDANGSGKGKERRIGGGTGIGLRPGAGTGNGPRSRPRPMSAIYEAPALARRASSFFEELSELKGKSASELWRSVVESRAAAANGGKGDTRAAEQRITPWQDDAGVSACPHCSASFHPLTNRKHHCRLCGRIVCSLPVKNPQRPVPCSLLFVSDKTGRIEEVTEGVDYGVKPRVRTTSTTSPLDKKGKEEEEKFLKGVRICRECKPVMLRQQYRQEAKRVPIMIRLYEALISLEIEIEETLPQFQELMLSLSNNPDEAPTKEASAARKHLLECFSEYDALGKRIRKIPCPGGPGSSQDRVQAAIQARANMVLQKKMFPLQSLPKPKKRSSNNGTSNGEGEGEKEVIDPDSELARALQPLLEQEALLETFVEEATRQRKFEDAKTLKGNLEEIRAEIDRIVASADGQLP